MEEVWEEDGQKQPKSQVINSYNINKIHEFIPKMYTIMTILIILYMWLQELLQMFRWRMPCEEKSWER